MCPKCSSKDIFSFSLLHFSRLTLLRTIFAFLIMPFSGSCSVFFFFNWNTNHTCCIVVAQVQLNFWKSHILVSRTQLYPILSTYFFLVYYAFPCLIYRRSLLITDILLIHSLFFIKRSFFVFLRYLYAYLFTKYV